MPAKNTWMHPHSLICLISSEKFVNVKSALSVLSVKLVSQSDSSFVSVHFHLKNVLAAVKITVIGS